MVDGTACLAGTMYIHGFCSRNLFNYCLGEQGLTCSGEAQDVGELSVKGFSKPFFVCSFATLFKNLR
jgi:hypothetical protein